MKNNGHEKRLSRKTAVKKMTESYKAIRLVNMKPKWVILDGSGKIINRNPKKEDLKDLNK